jgi:hypothetical protein
VSQGPSGQVRLSNRFVQRRMFFSIEKNVRKSANTVLVNAGKNNCHGFVWVQTNELL